MRGHLAASALCCLAATLACSDTSGPHAGLNVVSGAGVSDTVLSTFKPPLTVQLLDGDRQPMSGQTVYFNTNGFVLAAPIDDPGFVTDRLPVITDAQGGRRGAERPIGGPVLHCAPRCTGPRACRPG